MMLRTIAAMTITVSLLAGTAIAQTPAPSKPDGETPPAVRVEPNANPKAPLPGANSFTEEQARERIERAGMTAVTGLRLDEQGVWRGKAVRGADPVDVSLDYRGNVVAN